MYKYNNIYLYIYFLSILYLDNNEQKPLFFAYIGNKRNEVVDLYNTLDLKNIDYIIEPFCGSCALSVYISIKHPKQY